MQHVAVDCLFNADGSVRVRRIARNGRWETVEQGRQWTDSRGRSILVMMPGGEVFTLRLAVDSLQWELHSRQGGETAV